MYGAQATLCISKLKALSPFGQVAGSLAESLLQRHLALGLVLLKGTQSISGTENELIRGEEKLCSVLDKPFPKSPKTIFIMKTPLGKLFKSISHSFASCSNILRGPGALRPGEGGPSTSLLPPRSSALGFSWSSLPTGPLLLLEGMEWRRDPAESLGEPGLGTEQELRILVASFY